MTITMIGILTVVYIIVVILEMNELDSDEVNTKNAWKSLIWPLLLVGFLTKLLIYVLNKFILFIGLLFGFKYKKTKMYTAINDLIE
jgi:hypothetical protein